VTEAVRSTEGNQRKGHKPQRRKETKRQPFFASVFFSVFAPLRLMPFALRTDATLAAKILSKRKLSFRKARFVYLHFIFFIFPSSTALTV
jgi:hypothetical protein